MPLVLSTNPPLALPGVAGEPPPAPAVSACIEVVETIAGCLRVLRSAMERQLGACGLSESHFSLLWICGASPEPGISQNQLAQALSVSAAHVSGQVELLRQRGWIVCHRSPHDRRRQLWRLTPAGTSLLQGLLAALAPWADALQRQFGAVALVQLQHLLQELGGVLAAQPAASSEQALANTANVAPATAAIDLPEAARSAA